MPGHRLRLDPATRVFDDGRLLLGGALARAVRLTPAGARTARAVLASPATTAPAGRLARRLVGAGLAHPVPPAADDAARRVAVVVPVLGRPDELDRCLRSLAEPDLEVVVVDDGSPPAEAVRLAATCDRHGATLLRHDHNRGPGAARTTGLAATDRELVAFVDSDVEATQGWLTHLVGHLDDPAVAAVAPRVVPLLAAGGRTLRVHALHRSPLDLGPLPGPVVPYGRIGHVPSAALLVRRSVLAEQQVAFDPTLRVGEDVDLVWRLVGHGLQVRYEPAVRVHHHEPTRWRALLRRRLGYGASVGPLARRHPTRVAHVRATPSTAAAVLALACGRPVVAAGVAATATAGLARRLHGLGVPPRAAAALALGGQRGTATALLRAATMLAWPVLATVAATRPDRRRLVAAAMALPALDTWVTQRPALDPLRWVLAGVADDVAYGTGVLVGSWRARTVRPLLPRLDLGAAAGRRRADRAVRGGAGP